MRGTAALAALAALAVAACGGDGESQTLQSTRTVPGEPQATKEERPPSTTTGSRPEAPQGSRDGRAGEQPTRGEDQPGGGGDANARVPAVYELGPGGRLTPRTIGVPEFLGIRLVVRSTDDEAHRVTLGVDPPVALTVPPRGDASREVMGQREGRFAVTVDGRRVATLEVGVEPGP